MPNGNIAPGSMKWVDGRKYPVVTCADCGQLSSASLLGKGVDVGAVLSSRPDTLPENVVLSLPTSHKCGEEGTTKPTPTAKSSAVVSRPVSLAAFAEALKAEIAMNENVLAALPKKAEELTKKIEAAEKSIAVWKAEIENIPDAEADILTKIDAAREQYEKVISIL